MAVNFKSLFWAACIGGLLVTNAIAAQQFVYNKTLYFNFASGTITHIRMTSAASDANGLVYFTNNVTDNIHVVDPMTFSGTETGNTAQAEVPIIAAGSSSYNNGFTGASYTGITVDKVTGAIYAAGPTRNQTTTPNNSIITRLEKVGTNWTITDLNKADSNAMGGIQSLGENKVVLTSGRTGTLYFFEYKPATQSLDPIGTILGNSSLWSPSLAIDPVNNRIFQGRSLHTATAKAADVDLFNFNYVTASNTFTGSRVGNYIAGTNSTDTTNNQPLEYQSIAVNDSGTLLAIPVNTGKTLTTDTGANNFQVYDISGPSPFFWQH